METIYVYLLNEGVDCWRPVEAVHVADNRYRISGVNPDPSDEHWQFATGDVVVCERRTLSEGAALVAVTSGMNNVRLKGGTIGLPRVSLFPRVFAASSGSRRRPF